MGTVYAVYFFSKQNEFVCAANQMDFFPLKYDTTDDLDQYLQRPGSINMTDRFDFVVKFGFVSNCIILAYTLTKMCSKEQTLEKIGTT